MTDNENISFLIDYSETTESEVTIDDKNGVQQYENANIYEEFLDNEDMTPYILNYQLNFTLRQLTQICDYYNISKPKKCNKDILIQMIIHFEGNVANEDIVTKRKMMWFYMEELKNDKYMKKYIVLW
jgi:hypothetical protein